MGLMTCTICNTNHREVQDHPYTMLHCHPCEICGIPVDCEDVCDGDQQSIVYCPEHSSLMQGGAAEQEKK